MNYRQNLRVAVIAVTLSSALLVLTKVILDPAKNSYQVSSYTFPLAVPLPGWQTLPSTSLAMPKTLPEYLSGRSYQYKQGDTRLTIEMRYLNDTSGEVKNLLENYTSISSSPKLRHRAGIGFYGIFIYQQKAYLSSCINPRGVSTVTQRQFTQNHRTYDIQINRLLLWLLGQKKLEDKRCLWTHLSTPLKSSSSEAYQLLENAWFTWYQWWYPRFPKP